MQDPYKIDFNEDLELSLQHKKFLKNCRRVYKVLCICEIPAAIAFGVFKMPEMSVACGLTSFAMAIGVGYLKIEEKEVDIEIEECKKKIAKQQENEQIKRNLKDKLERKL